MDCVTFKSTEFECTKGFLTKLQGFKSKTYAHYGEMPSYKIQTLLLNPAVGCVSACDPVFVLQREAMDSHSTSLAKPQRLSLWLPPSISK